MALQSSGAISISQIKTELGNSSNSLRALSAAAGKSVPDSMSEFYGYSAFVPPILLYQGSDQGDGAFTAGSGYASDPFYFFETNPGPFEGQSLFYFTETGLSIANESVRLGVPGFAGAFYKLTVSYLSTNDGYILPVDADGSFQGPRFWDSIPFTFTLSTNSRGFLFVHFGPPTPYDVEAIFHISP